jgi:hypothetical protein
MRHLLLFLFALLFITAVFSQNVDTAVNYQLVNGTWQPVSRIVIAYDASCRADTTTNYQFVNSMWQPVSRDVTTYVASSGKVSADLNQQWQTSSSLWVNTSRTSFIYNLSNQVTQQLTQVWDMGASSWDNSTQSISTHNSNNLLDSVLSQTWLTGAWQNSALTVDSYNADNLERTSTDLLWVDTSWTVVRSGYYYYYTNKSIEQIFVQSVSQRITYLFDTLNRETSIDAEDWLSCPHDPFLRVWVPVSHVTFAYNAFSDLISETVWHFAETNCMLPPCHVCYNQVFAEQITYTYTYNGDGTIAEMITNQVSDTTRTTNHYSASCLLPLTLLNFTAALNGKAAQLQWTTATEINTKNFIVQRSIDAMHFQNIGSVNAVGNSSQITSYGFADAGAFNAGANKLYYRLQMVDKDGKFTYSNIATVQIVNEKPLVIYPNPVAGELKLSGHLNAGGTVNIQIINSVGQTVLREDHNFDSGDFNTGIDLSKLPPGVYLVVVNDSTERTALSIIKQ